MHSGILFISVLLLICWGIQLLPVISVPITGKSTNYNLNLSHYNNVSFGVFGVCDTVQGTCSSPKIGYEDDTPIMYPGNFQELDPLSSFAEVELPSNVTYLISKLLVLHVVAFGFTCLLALQSISLLLMDSVKVNNLLTARVLKRWRKLRNRWSTSKQSSSLRVSSKTTPGRKHNYRQLTIMFLFAILSFLLSLLAFLADFVLFVPNLGPLGWIQMLPVLIMAIIASFSCFLKRSIQSRRHLNDSVYLADDMRGKNTIFVEWDDDTHSDDGVIIYSNGFTSEHVDEEQEISALLLFESETQSLSSHHNLNSDRHSINLHLSTV
ncbi:pali-domain-containing protein [Metschnikowia bicuspidata var. bicuspidata NRRL YB-4993]|uniref:Pali-domain-containing protein n=1 Tax=Metschnikowia bicuspidata var. bicuspidata NRRL YB-4993 TaxID=869754 RepID=A0A1A0H557_9ASCO|nr:pali-domain-containing protein [Metschnikowia bicuspidata var. bicuspidata NRRL YB-4993]OBA19042.1 pali-domain-containing protein [Metschnikowia bicuspidata var. bicuspidata NRRL YB-4993]